MTRRLFLFLAVLSALCLFRTAAAEEGIFRVMSFNILTSFDGKANDWDGRKDLVAAEIKEVDPLLFGVQEATQYEMDDLCTAFPEYAFIGVGRDDGKQGGEYCAVFYKKDNLEVKDSGTFWLSETPDEPGTRGWDAACKRVVSWGKFYCPVCKKTFVYANTHFDHISEAARVASAKLVLERADILTEGGKLPFFISGDFNCNMKSEAYGMLTTGFDKYKGFSDTFKTAEKVTAPVARTWNDMGNIPTDDEDLHIDFIFINDQVEAKAFQINNDLRDGQYPSDHNSIFAELKLK